MAPKKKTKEQLEAEAAEAARLAEEARLKAEEDARVAAVRAAEEAAKRAAEEAARRQKELEQLNEENAIIVKDMAAKSEILAQQTAERAARTQWSDFLAATENVDFSKRSDVSGVLSSFRDAVSGFNDVPSSMALLSRISSATDAAEQLLADQTDSAAAAHLEHLHMFVHELQELKAQAVDVLAAAVIAAPQSFSVDRKDGSKELYVSAPWSIVDNAEAAFRRRGATSVAELTQRSCGRVVIWSALGKSTRARVVNDADDGVLTLEVHKGIASAHAALRIVWTERDEASVIAAHAVEQERLVSQTEGASSDIFFDTEGRLRLKSAKTNRAEAGASAGGHGRQASAKPAASRVASAKLEPAASELEPIADEESKEGENKEEEAAPAAPKEEGAEQAAPAEAAPAPAEAAAPAEEVPIPVDVAGPADEHPIEAIRAASAGKAPATAPAEPAAPAVRVVGGILSFELLALPAAAVNVKGMSLHRYMPLNDPANIRRLADPSATSGQNIKVKWRVPSSILVGEEPMVARFDKRDAEWKQDVGDVTFDRATRVLTFVATKYQAYAMVQLASCEVPYRSLVVAPRAPGETVVSLTTQRLALQFLVTKDGCTLYDCDVPELKAHFSSAAPRSAGQLLTALESSGVFCRPSARDVSAADLKVSTLEASACEDVAEVACSFELHVSRWNSKVGASTIVCLAREHTPAGVGRPRLSAVDDPTSWHTCAFFADAESPRKLRACLTADREASSASDAWTGAAVEGAEAHVSLAVALRPRSSPEAVSSVATCDIALRRNVASLLQLTRGLSLTKA